MALLECLIRCEGARLTRGASSRNPANHGSLRRKACRVAGCLLRGRPEPGGCAPAVPVVSRPGRAGGDVGAGLADRRPRGRVAQLDEFVASEDYDPRFFPTGGPGVGKTTLWEAGVELARHRGLRVLSARASGAETQLAFAALTDLLDPVGEEELATLPPPQRHALEVALLRAEPTGEPPPRAAIASASSTRCARWPRSRRCSSRSTTCSGSTRRPRSPSPSRPAGSTDQPGSLPLRERKGGSSSSSARTARAGPQHLAVEPLSFGATQRLLAERLGLRLPRHVLRRVVMRRSATRFHARARANTRASAARRDRRGCAAAGHGRGAARDARGGAAVSGAQARARGRAQRRPSDLARRGHRSSGRAGRRGRRGRARRRGRPRAPGAPAVHDRREEPHALERAARAARRAGEVAGDEESRALHLALAAERPDEELAAAVAAAAAGAARRGARAMRSCSASTHSA